MAADPTGAVTRHTLLFSFELQEGFTVLVAKFGLVIWCGFVVVRLVRGLRRFFGALFLFFGGIFRTSHHLFARNGHFSTCGRRMGGGATRVDNNVRYPRGTIVGPGRRGGGRREVCGGGRGVGRGRYYLN